MKDQLDKLVAFHRTFGVHVEDAPTADLPGEVIALRVSLIQEELDEYRRAGKAHDLVAVADALTDLLYVVLGSLVTHGLQEVAEALFDEVHESNMSKLDSSGRPIYRADGKVMKSAQWHPPDLASVLGSGRAPSDRETPDPRRGEAFPEDTSLVDSLRSEASTLVAATSARNASPLLLRHSAIEAIGDTPLVELARLTHETGGRLLAKLEYLNPGFSKKDRIARQMIEDAEADGQLQPGQTVVELTSGNTGTGLAIVCTVKGYPFVAVMSRGNSIERARMMAALGAEVVLVDQLPDSRPGEVSGGDLARVEQETQRIVRERGAFRADQFRLWSNFRAHYLHTGPEILTQSGGQIDGFCDFAGTAGSFAGCAAAFKEYSPAIRCYLVEPATAAVLAGHPVTDPRHLVQGGGYAIPDLTFVNRAHVDGYLQVSKPEVVDATRRLARIEGIFAGFSSGANLAAALQLLQGELAGKTIAILINDSGLKYLSTGLWK